MGPEAVPAPEPEQAPVVVKPRRHVKKTFVPFPTDAETDGKGRAKPDGHIKRQCNEFEGVWMAHLEGAGGEEGLRNSEKEYERACAEARVLPSPAVMDQLSRRRLELAYYGIGPIAGKTLGAAFACNNIVKYIDLSGNSLGSSGLEAICSALVGNTTVARVNLARNNATTDHPGLTAALVKLLSFNRTICALNISSNRVGDRSIRQVLEAAVEAARHSLTELDVGGTGLVTHGVSALAQLFTEGSQLCHLGVSGLQVPSAAWAEVLLPALLNANSISAVDFSHNNLSDASLGPLMECFERLQLQMCDVTSCGFSDGGIALLTQNLHKPGEAPSLQILVMDVKAGRAMGKAKRAMRREAKKANGGVLPADFEKQLSQGPKVSLRPGTLAEVNSASIDKGVLSANDVLRPASVLLTGPDGPGAGRPASRFRRYESHHLVRRTSNITAHLAAHHAQHATGAAADQAWDKALASIATRPARFSGRAAGDGGDRVHGRDSADNAMAGAEGGGADGGAGAGAASTTPARVSRASGAALHAWAGAPADAAAPNAHLLRMAAETARGAAWNTLAHNPKSASSMLAAAVSAAGARAKSNEPTLPWESESLRKAVEREMTDLAEEAKAKNPSVGDMLWYADVWSGTRGEALEQALAMAKESVWTKPLDVQRRRELALAKQALCDYHAASAAFLEAMEGTQEDPAMVAGFRQALSALRIRRARLFPEAARFPQKRNGWGKYADHSSESESEEEVPEVKPTKYRRRHQKYLPTPDQPDPPANMPQLCWGFENMMRRLWSFFETGPDSPEWERYRMREYLLDAQADLRVMYDWYRSNPLPGEPPMKPENAVGICVNESHCVQPAIDLEGVRPKGCGEEFYVCDVCKSFGPMTINAAWRHSLDAEMNTSQYLQVNLDRILKDALLPDVPNYGPAPTGEALPDDLTVPRNLRSEEQQAEAAEAARFRANHGLHVGSMHLGFYEWCEYLARVAYVTHNGKKEGISWAFDRALISVVPDDVAMAILPWECYGEGGPNYTPEEEEVFRATIGKPVVKQPLTWNVVLARGDLAPPLVDARDAFRKRFQGPGRSEFMEKHRNRMMRTFLFFGDTEKGGHFKASDEKALEFPGDVTQNFNEVLKMFDRLDIYNADLNPTKLKTLATKVLGAEDVLGQEHPNNVRIEFCFEQWVELLARAMPSNVGALLLMPPPAAKGQAKGPAAKPAVAAPPGAPAAGASPAAPAATAGAPAAPDPTTIPAKGTAAYMWMSFSAWLDNLVYPLVQKQWPGTWKE